MRGTTLAKAAPTKKARAMKEVFIMTPKDEREVRVFVEVVKMSLNAAARVHSQLYTAALYHTCTLGIH